jgi:hypothetical protein
MSSRKKTLGKPNKFLLRLFNMLSDPKHESTIGWTESGLSFEIKNIPEFSTVVLPQYFKHKNFSSFVRQLNMYDFHKERDTGEVQIYGHPCFVRGEKEKLTQVHRKTSDQYVESKPVMTLEKKYNIISSKQKLLTEKISALEQNYQEVASYNQSLLFQILQSREREHKIEELLIMFADRIKDVPAFLEPFSKKKEEFEIVKPIPIPIHQQFRF